MLPGPQQRRHHVTTLATVSLGFIPKISPLTCSLRNGKGARVLFEQLIDPGLQWVDLFMGHLQRCGCFFSCSSRRNLPVGGKEGGVSGTPPKTNMSPKERRHVNRFHTSEPTIDSFSGDLFFFFSGRVLSLKDGVRMYLKGILT